MNSERWSVETRREYNAARLKALVRMERQRTKGGAPLSAALKDKRSITPKVLYVNVYLSVIRMNAERVERMWFADS